MSSSVKAEFEKNKYVKISKGVTPEIIEFCRYYIEVFAYRHDKIMELLPNYYNGDDHGEFILESHRDRDDFHAGNSFNKYGDLMSESLLLGLRESIGTHLGLELVPTYGYFRIYTEGNDLKKHIDRDACEISMTICVGCEGESWPIFIDGTPVYQEPGDLIIYRGCEVEHWREAFEGTRHAQMFLHYNDKNGSYGEDNLYDSRPFVGMPAWTGALQDTSWRRS